ncbi:MAG: hypothetical protein PHX64_05805 [Candidatus Omnitrophica bacterium]|nr:hypothetical protein [Candidatus Omnitrophota bacterium]MDD5311248.1 hypothetical protein [Candidatus Omnitrophota bacterium]MDD5545719.1 hypothetical protein [Candidatus Omnitrophota bacterium]
MFWKKPDKTDKNVKNLTEKDIQKQLYGNYLDKVEVMDSSFIVKENEESPIQEKPDAKMKKELNAELEELKGEFKRLQGEVNRLKKDKESLERPEIWFKPPFLKSRQLVVIGSIVVLILAAYGSFFAVKLFISKVSHKEPVLSGTAVSKKVTVPSKNTAVKKSVKKVKGKKP